MAGTNDLAGDVSKLIPTFSRNLEGKMDFNIRRIIDSIAIDVVSHPYLSSWFLFTSCTQSSSCSRMR